MGRYITERERTERAYRAYANLLDTAEWFRDRARRQLETFDLTVIEYQMMDNIFRDGPQYQMELSRRFRCGRLHVQYVTKRLEKLGRVTRVYGRLRGGRRPSHARASKGKPLVRVFLTEEGRELIAKVFRKHAKYVKAEMRVLDGREQHTLSWLCRKLQRSSEVNFIESFV